MRLSDGEILTSRITSSSTVHIYGAGLNKERPAHTAVKELSDRGWAIAPIHPKDGGATIDGFPIRPGLDEGIIPEIVVKLLLSTGKPTFGVPFHFVIFKLSDQPLLTIFVPNSA